MMQYRSGGTWCNKGVGEHDAIKEWGTWCNKGVGEHDAI